MIRRVLVVDDDRAMVQTLCDILQLKGWEARGAYSGEEALASQEAEHWPVVLMDIRMPGIDGVEACRAMMAMTRKAWGVLAKPFDVPELLGLLA